MRLALAALLLLISGGARAGEALVAVATNFLTTAQTLAADFEATTDHRITLASGATGTLFAQIRRGAPFDLFLAADHDRPAQLAAEGLAEPPVIYATGTLTLWSADPDRITGPDSLTETPPRRFAIANPDLAPYGAAAQDAIAALGWSETLEGRIVRGENVGQAFAMIATGNAEVGLIATSALHMPRTGPRGSHWPVPPGTHRPIQQAAVLTPRGAANPAARAFLDHLTSPKAAALIAASGYLAP